MKLILMTFLLIFVTSSSSTSLNCIYSNLTGFPYSCNLAISNPDGRDNFERINGTHVGNLTDQDVVRVVNAYGDTPIIPQIICQQFPNLLELQFHNASIRNLTEAAFRNCHNLRRLILVRNTIVNIPGDIFNGSRKLEEVQLHENSIQIIHNETFHILSYLKILYLSGNQGINLPSDLFVRSSNLETLFLDWCGIHELNPVWFKSLRNLKSLRLQDNFIKEIPDHIFAPLEDLLDFQFQRNLLRQIKSTSFHYELKQLNRILFHQNQIDSIDPEFFAHAPNLYIANFADNICVNANISQFNLNRDQKLKKFTDCFNAFDPFVAHCIIYNHTIYGPTCEIFNLTYTSLSGTLCIIANHSFLNTIDDQVTGFIFTTSHLEKVPSTVFETFNNLVYLQVRQSGLSEITEETFKGCIPSLKFIDASYNCIKQIAGHAFEECTQVEDIRLSHNCIYSIQPCRTFFVDNLVNLRDLNMNQNVCIDQNYAGINATVKDQMKNEMRGCFGMWYD